MNRFLRGVVVLICMALIGAVLLVCFTPAQEAPAPAAPAPPATTFEISGVVKSGKTPLPGVTVTASNTLTGKKFSTATAPDGSYTLKGLPRGRYVVKVEFMGFASQTQEVTVNPDNPAAKTDTELVLASRQQEEQANRVNNATAALRGFQNLAVEGTLATLAGNGNANGNMGSASDLASLPMNGAGADLSTESVSVAGTQGRSQDFAIANEDELQQRIQEFRDRVQREGGAFGAAMPGGATQGGPGDPGEWLGEWGR